ncbi:MAG: hypothetical protein ACI4JG_10760 [Acutalibacteraceae bacterium]
MFYENWMSYIKDDAKITKIAIPASHNAATMGMPKPAKCQNGSLYKQYKCGVREFGIRLKTDRSGRLFIAHGITKGMPAEQAFENLGMIVSESDEFFIFDIRTYSTQKIGPLTLSYGSDSAAVSALIKKYLNPEKYALTDFDDIGSLTVGDIRKSGKKYLIINAEEEYDFSRGVPLLEPWDPKVFGYKPEKFAKECLNYLRELETDGFFWFQTQQTPNPGTENGLKWPDDLDELDRPLFPKIIADIAADPAMLEKVNIVAGDFMTRDSMKVNEILNLNLLKGVVKDELREEFAEAIGKGSDIK